MHIISTSVRTRMLPSSSAERMLQRKIIWDGSPAGSATPGLQCRRVGDGNEIHLVFGSS